jgi:hypothetical protein
LWNITGKAGKNKSYPGIRFIISVISAFGAVFECPEIIGEKIDKRAHQDPYQVRKLVIHVQNPMKKDQKSQVEDQRGPDSGHMIFKKAFVQGLLFTVPPGPKVIQQKIGNDGCFYGNDAGKPVIKVKSFLEAPIHAHIDQDACYAHGPEFQDARMKNMLADEFKDFMHAG